MLKPRQNDRHFLDDIYIFKYIFLDDNVSISIKIGINSNIMNTIYYILYQKLNLQRTKRTLVPNLNSAMVETQKIN